HRAHASVVGVAQRIPAAAGRLLQREVEVLSKVRDDPGEPFVAILGGAKVGDKLGVVDALLDRVDALLVGGAMAFSFLAVQGAEEAGAGALGGPPVHGGRGVGGVHRGPGPARHLGADGGGVSVARRPIIAANWKMHKTHLEAIQFTQQLSYLLDAEDAERVDVVICPPFTALRSVQTLMESDRLPFGLGAQNVHPEAKGAFTGEVSPSMLAALKVGYVIVGHSERRELFGETDQHVARKGKAVFAEGMTPILCGGETL